MKVKNLVWLLLLVPNIGLFILDIMQRIKNPHMTETELLIANWYWYAGAIIWSLILGILAIWLEWGRKK